MKKIIFSVIAISALALAGTASAQTGMMGGYSQGNTANAAAIQPLNDAVQNIYKSQNVSSQAQLDCSKVTDDQFEKLGDTYMGVMAGSEAQHTAMENMMGGEGSADLKQAHINMGRSYLGCWSNYNSGPVYMPMMGGYGMMNGYSAYNNYYPGGMMGGYGSGWSGWNMMGNWGFGGWITTVLIWALLALGIAAAVKWLRKK